jgi:hypothetical protein
VARSPEFKVYSPDGEYIAACKDVEDAACLVAFRGDGATIRINHKRVVWTEGLEQQTAGESYDYVRDVVSERRKERSL